MKQVILFCDECGENCEKLGRIIIEDATVVNDDNKITYNNLKGEYCSIDCLIKKIKRIK